MCVLWNWIVFPNWLNSPDRNLELQWCDCLQVSDQLEDNFFSRTFISSWRNRNDFKQIKFAPLWSRSISIYNWFKYRQTFMLHSVLLWFIFDTFYSPTELASSSVGVGHHTVLLCFTLVFLILASLRCSPEECLAWVAADATIVHVSHSNISTHMTVIQGLRIRSQMWNSHEECGHQRHFFLGDKVSLKVLVLFEENKRSLYWSLNVGFDVFCQKCTVETIFVTEIFKFQFRL